MKLNVRQTLEKQALLRAIVLKLENLLAPTFFKIKQNTMTILTTEFCKGKLQLLWIRLLTSPVYFKA